MSINEAKKIIHEEANAKIGRLAMASCVMSEPENDEHTTFSDLLLCLERGNQFGGLNVINEVAALALFGRTNRKRDNVTSYESLITDVADWQRYLNENGFMEQQ